MPQDHHSATNMQIYILLDSAELHIIFFINQPMHFMLDANRDSDFCTEMKYVNQKHTLTLW